MTRASWTVRPLGDDDLPELFRLDNAAFHVDPPGDFLDGIARPMLAGGRLTGVRDPAADDVLVGSAAILPKALTFPGTVPGTSRETLRGGRPHPVAAVTFVAVRAGWRRRGILSALMRDQLHGLHETSGEPVAVLTASEGTIYGRFGYGRAIDAVELSVPHGAPFAAAVPTEPVRECTPQTAADRARALWDRVAPATPGHLSRTDGTWHARFAEHEFLRRGLSERRWAAHADGVVGYRVRPSWVDRDAKWVVVVTDLIAATPAAHASLWRFVLDLDLTDRVEYPLGWPDDPLQDLLTDRRSLTITPRDHVWLRIVDLDRAVPLRAYAVAATVDVEIVDDGCPWNAGTWRLELTPDGGRAARTGAAAELRMHARDLGACLMGGTPLARLVAAGAVAGSPDAARRLGLALSTPVAPWCPEGF